MIRTRGRLIWLPFSLLLVAILAWNVGRYHRLFWPGHYFEYNEVHSSFSVYSDKTIDDSLRRILHDAHSRLLASEFFDTTVQYRLYICHDAQLYGQFAEAAGRPANTQGFHLHPLGYTFINMSYIEEVKRRNLRGHMYSMLEGNAAHIIAHEVTHELIEDQMGFWKARELPAWKVEGYCEYIAGQAPQRDNLANGLSAMMHAYQQGVFYTEPPERRSYIRSQLLVAYFMSNREGSFDKLMLPETAEVELWKRMTALSR